MSPTDATAAPNKLAQLHPEDLFDKEARGTITSSERGLLEAHVMQCSACKMERLLRADFDADDGERISFTNLVEGALGEVAKDDARVRPASGALGAPLVPTGVPDVATVKNVDATQSALPRKGAAPLSPAAPWKRFALLFAAAFVLLCSAAAASEKGRALARQATSMLSPVGEARDKEPSPKVPSVPVGAGSHAVNPLAAQTSVAIAPPIATDNGTLDPTPTPALTPVHAPTQGERPATVGAPSNASTSAPARTSGNPIAVAPAVPVVNPVPVTPAAAAPVPDPPAKDDAPTALAQANAKRHAGNRDGALAGYADVIVRFPSTREAAVSHALRGRILLEQRDAPRALVEFDAYLAMGRGELREEALVGRARAFGILGQPGAERTAWDTLLASYPRSASAEHARLRLDALGAR